MTPAVAPITFADLPSFDQINLGATLVQTAVSVAFAMAVAGVWLTHRRPAMHALAAYWLCFAGAAMVNVLSSWSGAIWRDRVLSLSLTTVVVALHAAAIPFARASVRRLAQQSDTAALARQSLWFGVTVLLIHGGGVAAALTWWPEVRLIPVVVSRTLHAMVFLVPAFVACRSWNTDSDNRLSIRLLALGLSALAVRGLFDLVMGLRVGLPDLSGLGVAGAILFNLLGLIVLGVASLIAMAAEEQQIVQRQADELRRAEQSRQQGQRLESLGRLASGVAHDFNNVLAVVMATADNLRDEAITPTQREDIESLAGAADRGRALVRQLLTFARQQPVSNDRFDAAGQLRQLEPMLGRLAEGRTVRVIADNVACPIHMDRVGFDQVVLNLVANARDASPPHSCIDITLTAGATRAPVGVLAGRREPHRVDGIVGTGAVVPSTWVCVAVEDAGTGISPEVLPYVFEPFFSTKPTDRGTGIGLATVLGIVARAGGDIVVKSEPGRGTRFEIWLPRTADAVPPATQTA